MKAFVYFNLRKKCYSIKALEGENKGRVIAHARRVYMEDVTFKVSEAGRQRVLSTKRKNVHAGVQGTLIGHVPHGAVSAPEFDRTGLTKITYNPYKRGAFVTVNDPVIEARYAAECYLNEQGCFGYNCTFYIKEFDMSKEG